MFIDWFKCHQKFERSEGFAYDNFLANNPEATPEQRQDFFNQIHEQNFKTAFAGFVGPLTKEAAFAGIMRIAESDPLPLVDGGLVVKLNRSEDGQLMDEPEWVSNSRLSSRGSYQSHYMIKCDGSNVYLDGNIGRWNRPDNLFGLDLMDTWSKASEIAVSHGLLPFTVGRRVDVQLHDVHYDFNPVTGEITDRKKSIATDYDRKHGLDYKYTGAIIDELHLTQNYVTGNNANAIATMAWLQTQSQSRVKRNVYDTVSVAWGQKKSRRIYIKAYIKADEMMAHAETHGKTKEEMLQDPVYQFCRKHGVVRFEIELGDLYLREKKLRYMGDCNMPALTEIFNKEVNQILGRVRGDLTRIDLSECDLNSGQLMAAQAYLRGEDIKAALLGAGKKATFYRYRTKLLELGIDINEPLGDCKRLTTVIKVIDIKPMVEAPSWYWDYQSKMVSIAANESALQEAA